MSLKEQSEKEFTGHVAFENGMYRQRIVLDEGKNCKIEIKDANGSDGLNFNFATMLIAKSSGEECKERLVWHTFYDIQSGEDHPQGWVTGQQKFAKLLKMVGLLDEFVETFGGEPDWYGKRNDIQMWLQINLPYKIVMGNVKEVKRVKDDGTDAYKLVCNVLMPYDGDQPGSNAAAFDDGLPF